MPLGGAFVGLFAVILCPILYGIFGGIVAAISALIYNLASGWVGGLEVELNRAGWSTGELRLGTERRVMGDANRAASACGILPEYSQEVGLRQCFPGRGM